MRLLFLLALLLQSQIYAEAGLTATASVGEAALKLYYDEALNQGLSMTAQAMLDENFSSDAAMPGMKKGRDGFISGIAVLRKAFPDMKVEVLEMISQGDSTVLRYRMTGTHKGKLLGLRATQKKISVTGIEIWKFKGAKAVEHHGNFDALGMLQQLKVVPELK